MARYAIDLAPLRKSKDFSLLWAAGLISYFGSMITYVAVPFQIKELTGSYVAVAISGLVEILPLIIFGLYGGVLADALDRKKLIWVTELLSLLFTAILLINSMMDSPSLLLIYIVSGLFAATSGLRQPAMQAALPRLVDHEDMTAAAALMSLRWQIGVIVGPAIGGILISTYSENQQQAMLVTFFLMMIFVLMGGLYTSIDSMPDWARWFTKLNPISHFIEVMRMVVLKGSGIADVGKQFVIMIVYAIVINTWAVLSYRKRA